MAFASLCCSFVPQTELFSIYGQVKKPNGDPVPEVAIILSEIDLFGNENIVANAITGDDGQYRFDDLERTGYGIVFSVKTLTTGFKPIIVNSSRNEYNFDMTMTPDFRTR